MAGLEALIAAFAGISAFRDAVSLWSTAHNQKATADAVNNSASYTAEVSPLANEIISIIPSDTLDLFIVRVNSCHSNFNRIISNVGQPEFVVDRAVAEYKLCTCRELNRIKAIGGNKLPAQFLDKWTELGCGDLSLPVL